LEKNHRYEINQELAKQRDLKRQLEARSEKYNELVQKFEDKTRQIDTMHIYVQRTNKRSSVSTSNLSKSRSLQSLQDTSPRVKDEKKKQQSRPPQPPPSLPSINDSSSKKVVPKKEPIEQKPENGKTMNSLERNYVCVLGHLPPKGKPPARRLSTPKSVAEEESKIDDDDTFFVSSSKKLPPSTNLERDEQHLSRAQIHRRSVATESKSNSSVAFGSTTTKPSSIFKLTEPPPPSKPKPRPARELDEKWSDMFGSNKQEDSTKDDLLAKLVADEQQERRLAAAAQPPPVQRPTMTMFESSTHSTTTTSKYHLSLFFIYIYEF
jgi:hypothetical protein